MKNHFLLYVFLAGLLTMALSTNIVFAEHNKKHANEIMDQFNQQLVNDKLTIALFNAAVSALNLPYSYSMEILYYYWVYPRILSNRKSVSKVLVVDLSNKPILNVTDLYESEIKGSTNLIVVTKALQKVKDEVRKLAPVPKVKVIIANTTD